MCSELNSSVPWMNEAQTDRHKAGTTNQVNSIQVYFLHLVIRKLILVVLRSKSEGIDCEMGIFIKNEVAPSRYELELCVYLPNIIQM